jgi:malate/lactate dehydrogenase
LPAALSGANIVVVPAGVPRKPGKSSIVIGNFKKFN